MSATAQTPILPPRQAEERPLFFILAIMSCLAGLTLMLTLFGVRFSQNWQSTLMQSATVQILSKPGQSYEDVQNQAVEILRTIDDLKTVEPISQEASRDLLRPWLGDVDLPDDLPIPILISIDTRADAPLETELIVQRLKDGGIDAVVDDHQRWQRTMSSRWSQIRFALIGLLILILLATMGIVNFATQSALSTRRPIITVLQQVGATNQYITSLFVRSFLRMSLKAAFLGVLAAYLIMALLWLGRQVSGPDDGVSGLSVRDIIYLSTLALAIAIMCAGTAAYMSRKILRQSEYGA